MGRRISLIILESDALGVIKIYMIGKDLDYMDTLLRS